MWVDEQDFVISRLRLRLRLRNDNSNQSGLILIRNGK